MRPSRELNIRIATEIFGYPVSKQKGIWIETTPSGDRPLRNYSDNIQGAWEVAQKMKVTLIPVVENLWFAFVSQLNSPGWESPQAVLKFLEAGEFPKAGAAVDVNPALAICIAALNAVEKNKPNEVEEAVNEILRGTEQIH